MPPRRAFQIGHEQAVILPRIAADERAGSVITEAVGLDPFFPQGFSDILARGLIETKLHVHSFTAKGETHP